MRVTHHSSDDLDSPGTLAPQFAPPDTKHLSDEALVLCLRAATERQIIDHLFEEIFNRYQARVVNWCYALAKNREIALDLAQEVFLKVYRSLHAFRGDSRISTWIYVIARNHCINSIRKRDTDPSSAALEIPLNLEGDNGQASHQALENAESFQNIYRAISSILTPTEVRVLWLHYGNDHTLASITRQLVLSNRSGAKAFIVSAKRKLKLYLLSRGITSGALNGGFGVSHLTPAESKNEAAPQYRAVAA
jgi:RNA polymerase sigma factor (sigma-70 family)